MPTPMTLYGGGCGRKIHNGLLLRGAQYLTLTPAAPVAGNIWTLAMGYHQAVPTDTYLLSAGPNASNYEMVRLELNGSDPKLQYLLVVGGVTKCSVRASAKLRDCAGHYQLYVSRNGATVSMVVNGMALAAFDTTTAAADNGFFGTAVPHYIGRGSPLTTTCAQGVVSEIAFLPGVVAPQSAFGSFQHSLWTWKLYRGDYGNAGSLLEFRDQAQLGKDSRPLGEGQAANHWTLNGVLTADQVADTPTKVFPILDQQASKSTNIISEGGLRVLFTEPVSYAITATTMGPLISGKWYAEFRANAVGTHSEGCSVGLSCATNAFTGYGAPGQFSDGYSYIFKTGTMWNSGHWAYGAAAVAGDVVMMAVDLDAGKVWWGKNGAWFASGDPVAGLNEAFAGITGPKVIAVGGVQNFDLSCNFGQRPFVHTPPNGFKALCTGNAPPSTLVTSGTFYGNASTVGQRVFCAGAPDTLAINGNPVTWGVHAIKLATGFKVITDSPSYNASGSNAWVAVFGKKFVNGDCRVPNTAQIN